MRINLDNIFREFSKQKEQSFCHLLDQAIQGNPYANSRMLLKMEHGLSAEEKGDFIEFCNQIDAKTTSRHHRLWLAGIQHHYGYGVEINQNQAFILFENAVKSGNINALYHLGKMYDKGLGTSRNYQKVIENYRAATIMDDITPVCLSNSIHAISQNIVTSTESLLILCVSATQSGNIFALNQLGYIYENGIGIDKDIQSALKCYQLSMCEGNHWAENQIGVLYEKGVGIDKDSKKAYQHYRTAAKQGNIDALHNFGYMLQLGYEC